MDILEFKEAILKLGLDTSEDKLNKLERYYELLIIWNQKINLTAITEKEQVYLKHFYDSLTLIKAIDLNEVNSLCDLGTGAGFPGVVLKIFFPNLKLVLVDALSKRIKFLEVLVKELDLDDVDLVHMRAEEYGRLYRECFDVVTARALTSFPVLLEYGASLLKINGHLIAMRGLNDSASGASALKVLNCKINNVTCFDLPGGGGQRTLIDVQKISKTSLKYPRRYAEIKKKNL